MKKTKSALAIAAAAVLALTLTACGPSGNKKKDCEALPAGGVIAVERASLPMPVSPVRPVTPPRPSIPKPSVPKPSVPKPAPKPAAPKSGSTNTTHNSGMPWYWWIPFAGSGGDRC